MKLLERARELAAKTPPHRNRYVDWLRALSITVVVFGHWLMAVFTVQEGHVVARHLLAEARWARYLTWLFQVMPIFFMVGGYSNAASWQGARQAGRGYADWLRSRCQRLLGPTAVFALTWVPIVLFARLFIDDTDVLVASGRLVAVPLWFLAVYLLVVPLAPAMVSLHRRFGVAVPLVLVVAAALVDVLGPDPHVKGQPLAPDWSWINFAFVWLVIHQAGFFWRDGSLERSSATRWLLLALGLGGLIVVTATGLYPVSMIGVPGERTNNTPPTVALVLLAAAQMGIVLVSTRVANRRLSRTEPWARTILANGMIMTIYLWHLTALVLAVFVGFLIGYRFPIEPLSGLWWVSRVGWLALLAFVLAGFVALFGRFERPRPPEPAGGGRARAVVSGLGAVAAGAGLASLAAGGFSKPDEFWGLPVTALLLLVAGAVAVGVTPRIYRRP